MQSIRATRPTLAVPVTQACLGPAHVAIIMDGNGRWATNRGMPRSWGHQRGARNLGGLIETALELQVQVLTLYAFSSDNWRRPPEEVGGLMKLFASSLRSEAETCREQGVRLQVIGRRDRLPGAVLVAIERAQRETRRERRLLVRVAIDYSSRWAICSAMAAAGGESSAAPAFRQALARVTHSEAVCDPDLVLRTGGDQRLSDFLLWESAYAELFFVSTLWPDFGPPDLRAVIEDFRRRQRRFGGVPVPSETEEPV